MTQAPNKAQESLASMKNANKHLTEVLAKIDRMNTAMGVVIQAFDEITPKLGEVQLNVWHDNKWQPMILKNYIGILKAKLNSERF